MIVFAITMQMTIQHFLAQNSSKVLNGQHKRVCCPFSIGPFSMAVHLFSIGPGLVPH